MPHISESTMMYFLERLRSDFDKGSLREKEEIYQQVRDHEEDMPVWFVVELWYELRKERKKADKECAEERRERITQGII